MKKNIYNIAVLVMIVIFLFLFIKAQVEPKKFSNLEYWICIIDLLIIVGIGVSKDWAKWDRIKASRKNKDGDLK